MIVQTFFAVIWFSSLCINQFRAKIRRNRKRLGNIIFDRRWVHTESLIVRKRVTLESPFPSSSCAWRLRSGSLGTPSRVSRHSFSYPNPRSRPTFLKILEAHYSNPFYPPSPRPNLHFFCPISFNSLSHLGRSGLFSVLSGIGKQSASILQTRGWEGN